MLLLSLSAQQGSGPGFQSPCSVAEARGIKGKLRQLLQDYPSEARRGGEARGLQRGRGAHPAATALRKPAYPQDCRDDAPCIKVAPTPEEGKTLTDLPC